MIKIAHESPISIFEFVQNHTEYDYALVHLLDENEEYRKMFFKAKEEGREIYLDTSIFELGTAFEPSKFVSWIQELQPDYYFVPDTLENSEATINQMLEWNDKYEHKVSGKKIGVVQGDSYQEIVECYDFMNEQAGVDMIAFSFDYDFLKRAFPTPNLHISWALGRVALLGRMYDEGIINVNKKHHLLGCSLPLEFRFYREAKYNWIYSLDTSNPVVHAIKGIKYEENIGLMFKESQKLFELINCPAEKINKDILIENLYTFRRIVNGNRPGVNIY